MVYIYSLIQIHRLIGLSFTKLTIGGKLTRFDKFHNFAHKFGEFYFVRKCMFLRSINDDFLWKVRANQYFLQEKSKFTLHSFTFLVQIWTKLKVLMSILEDYLSFVMLHPEQHHLHDPQLYFLFFSKKNKHIFSWNNVCRFYTARLFWMQTNIQKIKIWRKR